MCETTAVKQEVQINEWPENVKSNEPKHEGLGITPCEVEYFLVVVI